ncbi:hypothetical protein [Flavobacterium sp.]|uniref:hypothetical protein n=1 Tax=Flavobacterium sp. TaxID=239 RepID=UPI003751839D
MILITILFVGCKPLSHSFRSQFKEIYVNQFKLTYAKQLLKKSYNNSVNINSILYEDKSGFTEPILTINDYNYIDSITTIETNKIKIDSTESIGRVAEGAEGKHILSFLFRRIESTELNKTIKRRCKIAKSIAF